MDTEQQPPGHVPASCVRASLKLLLLLLQAYQELECTSKYKQYTYILIIPGSSTYHLVPPGR